MLGLLRSARGLTRALSQVRRTVAIFHGPVENLLDFFGHLIVGVGAQNLFVCVACFRRRVGARDLARLAIQSVVVGKPAIPRCPAHILAPINLDDDDACVFYFGLHCNLIPRLPGSRLAVVAGCDTGLGWLY